MRRLIQRTVDLLGRDSAPVRALRPLYRTLLVRLYGSRGMPWQINGTALRIDPALREHMAQVYDPSVVAWLRPRVKPGQVAWNIGANVGVYTLQLASWVGPTGRVVAVEPNPGACLALERHIRWNGMEGRVTVVPAAVGEQSGETTMFVDGANPMSAVGRPNPVLAERARAITVPITTLDALRAEGLPRPDWIVMDIEGYELFALRGAERLLDDGGPPIGIVLELHPDICAALGESPESLDVLLARHRRHIVPLRGDGDAHDVHSIVALEPLA
jgi:FkbM family methyltransferase